MLTSAAAAAAAAAVTSLCRYQYVHRSRISAPVSEGCELKVAAFIQQFQQRHQLFTERAFPMIGNSTGLNLTEKRRSSANETADSSSGKRWRMLRGKRL